MKDKYKFVAEQTANFQRDEGASVTESILAGLASPPDVIVCANDDMALGALQVVQEQGLDDRDHRLRRAARGAGVDPRRRADSPRSSRCRAARARGAGRAWSKFLREGTKPEPLVLLTPVAITKDNLDKAERLGEAS